MAILHRRTGTHGRVRGFRPGAHLRFPGWRRRLCALRHGALHREYRYHAAAPSGDVQEQLLRRSVAGHVDGADSAGIGAGPAEPGSTSDRRLAHEQDADRAGLSDLTRALPDPLSSSREDVSRKDPNTAETPSSG